VARRVVWKRPNPNKRPKRLSGVERKRARRLARKAGRPYPNLVDNMRVSRAKKA
jgi:hypothetical protein